MVLGVLVVRCGLVWDGGFACLVDFGGCGVRGCGFMVGVFRCGLPGGCVCCLVGLHVLSGFGFVFGLVFLGGVDCVLILGYFWCRFFGLVQVGCCETGVGFGFMVLVIGFYDF